MTALTLDAVIQRFLEHKRSLGRKYRSEQSELRLLVRFVEQRDRMALDEITPSSLEDFLASRLRPRSYTTFRALLLVCLTGLSANSCWRTSPYGHGGYGKQPGVCPFVFDTAQARLPLNAAAALPDNPRAPYRHPTYDCIFVLFVNLQIGYVNIGDRLVNPGPDAPFSSSPARKGQRLFAQFMSR